MVLYIYIYSTPVCVSAAVVKSYSSLSMYECIYLKLSIYCYLFAYLSIHLSTYFYLVSLYISFNISIDRSIYIYVYISIYQPINDLIIYLARTGVGVCRHGQVV